MGLIGQVIGPDKELPTVREERYPCVGLEMERLFLRPGFVPAEWTFAAKGCVHVKCLASYLETVSCVKEQRVLGHIGQTVAGVVLITVVETDKAGVAPRPRQL